ncbi:MAG: DMT family transporter [Pontibacterium sp.]
MVAKQALDRLAILILLGLCLIWGFQQITIKLALDAVSPIMQAGLRSIGATVLLCLWMRVRGIRIFESDGTGYWGLLAGLLFAGEFLLLYWSLEYTTASRAIVFLYTSPFVVALGVHFLVPGDRLGLLQVLGLSCAFSGVVIAFWDNNSLPNITWLGDVMALGAAILWGATTVVVKASPQCKLRPERVLLYQLGLSALILPLCSVLSGEPGVMAVTPVVVGSLLFQTIAVAFVSYLTWFWLIHHYPASRVASFGFFAPMLGVLFGALILDEPLTPMFVLALLLVAAGIFLVNRPHSVAQPEPSVSVSQAPVK